MNKRLGILDIWRLLACMMIMAYHLPSLDDRFAGTNYPFAYGWIWVEFFFIVTGCFTFKHFRHVPYSSADDVGKSAIEYTIVKFLGFMPYIITAFALRYGLMVYIEGVESTKIFSLIPEMLLLSRGDGLMPVLWFLSALFIVFPAFCCICQIKTKHLVYIFSMLFVIVVYDTYLIVLGVRTPTHLIRAIAGLLLGILVAYVSSLISQVINSSWRRLLSTLIEEGALLLAIYLTYNNSTITNLIIICFFVALSIMVSGSSYTRNIGGSATVYLEMISLGMYLNQDSVAIIINRFIPTTNIMMKMILYWLLNFILSGLICALINMLRKRIKLNRIQISF